MPERGKARGEGATFTPGPRPFWAGTLSFGLVSVPVELWTAHRSTGVRLRMLAPDGSPVARRYVCPVHDEIIPPEHIVRGYPVESGEYVVVSDEELEALEPEKSRDIDLRRFVPRDAVDPVFFERAYLLGPTGDSNKAYRLLAEALEAEEKIGIATFVMRGKEHLVAILGEDGVLRAETLRFADEVRSPEDVDLVAPKGAADERIEARVGAAGAAIDALTEDAIDDATLDELLRDEQSEALRALIERKHAVGEGLVETGSAPDGDDAEGDPDDDSEPADLVDFLKRRLQAAS